MIFGVLTKSLDLFSNFDQNSAVKMKESESEKALFGLDIHVQGSHRSLKSLKVLKFEKLKLSP